MQSLFKLVKRLGGNKLFVNVSGLYIIKREASFFSQVILLTDGGEKWVSRLSIHLA